MKAGTPTMGGLLIFGTVFLVTAPTNLFDKRSIFLPLGIIVATGILGLVDDFLTIEGRAKGRAGLNKRLKTGLLLSSGAGLGAHPLLRAGGAEHQRALAGQVRDGAALHTGRRRHLHRDDKRRRRHRRPGRACGRHDGAGLRLSTGSSPSCRTRRILATFSLTVVGATLGFLWYNAHPARVFMGDTGALALGSTLAVVALMTGWWLILPVVGDRLLHGGALDRRSRSSTSGSAAAADLQDDAAAPSFRAVWGGRSRKLSQDFG